ncbi:MAG: hypothetical protein HYW81_00425 [Parcubacteria group bacterium]|nr:hypothetical protein [Parcubacteria group bacterium]
MLLPLILNALLLFPLWRRAAHRTGALLAAGSLLFAPSAALAASINASDLIQMTNEARLERRAGELTPNHALTKAAQAKARDLLDGAYFAHTTPGGKPFYEWIEEAGYHYLYAGENLAIDFYENEPLMDAWMASATHRANILNENYTDIGIVSLRGDWDGRETVVVVQLFGSLLSDSPTVLGQTLENVSNDLGIRRDSLKTLAADLVMLPSLAGSRYFDIILKPAHDATLAASDIAETSIAGAPFSKIARGGSYQTLLKARSACCSPETTFALTEEQNGVLTSTPISYPTLAYLFQNFANRALALPSFPETLNTNLVISGILAVLLLIAFEAEIRREFRGVRVKR